MERRITGRPMGRKIIPNLFGKRLSKLFFYKLRLLRQRNDLPPPVRDVITAFYAACANSPTVRLYPAIIAEASKLSFTAVNIALRWLIDRGYVRVIVFHEDDIIYELDLRQLETSLGLSDIYPSFTHLAGRH